LIDKSHGLLMFTSECGVNNEQIHKTTSYRKSFEKMCVACDCVLLTITRGVTNEQIHQTTPQDKPPKTSLSGKKA